MTSSWIISQAILSFIGVAFVVTLLCRYRATISRVARRQEYQYRIFALRDQAIRLVVQGEISEDDAQWKKLYETLNAAAHTVVMNAFTSRWFGPLFTMMFLREPPSDAKWIEESPEMVREIWVSFAPSNKCAADSSEQLSSYSV